MPKINKQDYPALKTFFIEWMELFPPDVSLPKDHHPVEVLKVMESNTPGRARTGLGMAINDILESSWDFEPAQINAIDIELASKGIVTLSELRRRYTRQFKAIIKRGNIRDETEYYLVSGILASFTGEANDDERIKLENLLSQFEVSK